MGDATTRRRGDAATRRPGARVFRGWGRDSCCVSVVPWDPVVKEQGRWLTGIGGGGGAEDWMGFGALRHYIGRLRNRRWSGFRGLRRLRGLRLPGVLLAALLLRLLQVLDGGAEGALQLRALFGNVPQHDELLFAEFDELVDPPLALGSPGEQPLGGDHGFQVASLGAVLGLPVGIQLVPELGVVRGVFAFQDGGAGAQAVGEGVEADGGFAFRGFRTRGMLGILPVGFVVSVRNYHVTSPFWAWGFIAHTPIQ